MPVPFQKHVMFEQPCGKNMPNFAWEFDWHPSPVTRVSVPCADGLKDMAHVEAKGDMLSSAVLGLWW